ncbi:hypothetical protein QJQ45_014522, partial [Haematococcus lacustris]
MAPACYVTLWLLLTTWKSLVLAQGVPIMIPNAPNGPPSPDVPSEVQNCVLTIALAVDELEFDIPRFEEEDCGSFLAAVQSLYQPNLLLACTVLDSALALAAVAPAFITHSFLVAFASDSSSARSLLLQLSAGCGFWLRASVSNCYDPALGIMPSIPDQAALKTMATWLPNSSNQQHQWDYRSMPMLACPELCQVTASMSNASAVGLWSSSTCNTLARQLTSELSPDLPAATNFSCPTGSVNNRTWTLQSPALQPSEASQLMSQLLGQHGMALAALAASLNYDCSMAALTFSAYPIHRLSSTDCGIVSSVSVPALPCTDLCNAPLPYPFFYKSVSAPNLINGSSVPPDAGTIPSGDHAELLA